MASYLKWICGCYYFIGVIFQPKIIEKRNFDININIDDINLILNQFEPTLWVCTHRICDATYATRNESHWLHWNKIFIHYERHLDKWISKGWIQWSEPKSLLNKIFPAIKMKVYTRHIFVDFQVIFFESLIFQIEAIESNVSIKREN